MTEEHTQFEIVPTVTKEEAYRRVIEANSLLLSFDDGHKAVLSAAKKAELMALKQMKDNSTTLTISKQLGVSAYAYQVDNDCHPDESLRHAAIKHNEDPDRVLESKGKTWRHNKAAVYENPELFSNAKFGEVAVELRKSIRNSDTLSSGLTSVSAFSKLKARVETLEECNAENRAIIEALANEALSSRIDMDKIKEVSGWTVSDREKAITMKASGCRTAAIARTLGVTSRTVQRWLQDNDKNVALLSHEKANLL